MGGAFRHQAGPEKGLGTAVVEGQKPHPLVPPAEPLPGMHQAKGVMPRPGKTAHGGKEERAAQAAAGRDHGLPRDAVGDARRRAVGTEGAGAPLEGPGRPALGLVRFRKVLQDGYEG